MIREWNEVMAKNLIKLLLEDVRNIQLLNISGIEFHQFLIIKTHFITYNWYI